MLDFLSQLKEFAVSDHNVDKEVQVSMLRDCLILSLIVSSFLKVLVDHVLSLETPIALLLELTVFHEGSDDLQDQLELM